jgi:hypothetical protein
MELYTALLCDVLPGRIIKTKGKEGGETDANEIKQVLCRAIAELENTKSMTC